MTALIQEVASDVEARAVSVSRTPPIARRRLAAHAPLPRGVRVRTAQRVIGKATLRIRGVAERVQSGAGPAAAALRAEVELELLPWSFRWGATDGAASRVPRPRVCGAAQQPEAETQESNGSKRGAQANRHQAAATLAWRPPPAPTAASRGGARRCSRCRTRGASPSQGPGATGRSRRRRTPPAAHRRRHPRGKTAPTDSTPPC